jgi:hypothetical protein
VIHKRTSGQTTTAVYRKQARDNAGLEAFDFGHWPGYFTSNLVLPVSIPARGPVSMVAVAVYFPGSIRTEYWHEPPHPKPMSSSLASAS